MAELGLPDVMDHLAMAFSGIYEKLTERDQEVANLRVEIANFEDQVKALSNRIESHHKSLSERIEHTTDVAAGRDAR